MHVNIVDLLCLVPSVKINIDLKIYNVLRDKKVVADMLTDVKDLL